MRAFCRTAWIFQDHWGDGLGVFLLSLRSSVTCTPSTRASAWRLFTRNGHDWTDRYPRIVEAALRNWNMSFVLDGEAVLLGVNCGGGCDSPH